jgi:hypothetical protein
VVQFSERNRVPLFKMAHHDSHNPSVAEKMKDKLDDMKDKLVPGRSSESITTSLGIAPAKGQKQSVIGKIKDKVMPGRHESARNNEGLNDTTSGIGYETKHGHEDVRAAEEGHNHRIGEKIAHMMPGPPYTQRHEKRSELVED